VRGFPLLALTLVLAVVPAAAAQREPLLHQSGPLPGHGIRVSARGAILIDAAVVTVDKSVRRVAPITEGLRPGEKVEAWKLFYGTLLYSGNDSALALAIGAGGTRSRFVALMNEKAKALGMKQTHFRSPSGVIDRDNYSTAWDMAALARYAMWNPRFRAVVRTRVKLVPWAPPTYAKEYVNKNHLIGSYPGANGVKTGWTTKAKHCLVASVRRNGVWLIAVVLGADDSYGDAKKLFAYGFATRS
jgi:serine-type D-Ala-D-Ala carboxypeptidase (penicillin-binding protein 5/6)